MDQQIKKFVGRLRLWLFGRELVQDLLLCISTGVFLGAVLEVISFFVPWYSVHYWAAGAVSAGAAAALILALCRCPSEHRAAMILDRTGLKERTVTALELSGDVSLFAELQKKDTLEKLSGIRLHRQLPMGITWKRPCLLAAVCILFTVTCLLPSPAKAKAKDMHKVEKQAEEQIEKVEKVRKELKNDKQAEEQEKEYETLLDSIQKELKEADSREALEKALERAGYKLNQAAEKAEQKDIKDKMSQLSHSLNPDQGTRADAGQDKNGKKQAAEKQKAAGEAQALLKKLQEAGDLSNLSEEELAAAREALEKLANMADNQELASSLQSAASQIASGTAAADDLAAAQAAVSALKSAAASQLASAGGQSGSGNSNAGNSGSGNNGNSGSGNSGNGAGSGSGSGSGSGNGNGNGAGSGSGSGNGGSGSGTGTGWNYGSKNGKEKDITYNGEMVSVPGGTGDDENLTGRQNQGTSYVIQGGDSLTWSGNSVDYNQVIGEYSKQALSQISNSDYPAGVQDIVKSYFEELNQ